eukprot:TRINITY_DN1052_c0_g5_i1.p2 TRINITY_DN1052_c0_g5~~TRINITY_DN1052_c0_g5_i1.p2  ORF type:complete len:196 (-),score=34.47 TRINITY_DN1052_c0_g5_i1:1077-1664(-)
MNLKDWRLMLIVWITFLILFYYYDSNHVHKPTKNHSLPHETKEPQQPIPTEFGWFKRVERVLQGADFSSETNDIPSDTQMNLENASNEPISDDMIEFRNLCAVSFGRFDGDAYLDMLVVDLDSGTPMIFWNNQNGSFVQLEDAFFPASPFYLRDLHIVSSLWCDYNNDKFDDLVVSTSGGIFIFRNTKKSNCCGL